MILERIPDIQKLSSSEKFILVGELWDDLATHPTEVPISREIIEELDRRATEYRENPQNVVKWSDVRNRLLGSKKR